MPKQALTPDDIRTLKDMMAVPDVEQAIRAELPNLITAMLDLAKGVYAHEERRVGDEWVDRCYREKPDRLALTFLIENVIGKVPNRIEMTGDKGGPLKVVPWMPKLDAIEDDVLDATSEEEVAMLKEAQADVEEQ